MTTTTATPSSAAQIQELVSKATDPQKKIDLLTFRLEELEDRSSVEARKIRKQIRAIKDTAGIARTRLTLTKKNSPEPDPDEGLTVSDIFKRYKSMKNRISAARDRELFQEGLPESAEEVIYRAERYTKVHEDHTKPHSPACRKCHAIPDSERRCRKCSTPLCNCSLKDPDQLCRKCRKNHPRVQNTTKNLGTFGKK